jgi:hypothetical protein
MARRRPQRPRDPNQLGKLIVELSTGEKVDVQPNGESAMSSAQLFARSGGLRGGKARAEKLSAKRRKEIARKAAAKRWRKG